MSVVRGVMSAGVATEEILDIGDGAANNGGHRLCASFT